MTSSTYQRQGEIRIDATRLDVTLDTVWST